MRIIKLTFVTLAIVVPLAILSLNFAIGGLGGLSILAFLGLIATFILIKGIYDSVHQRKMTLLLKIIILVIIILCVFAFFEMLQDIKSG